MSKKTLLIADDHPIFREGLKHILAGVPWLELIAEADNGDSALEQIEQLAPDLVMLDIAMPGRDGLEVLKLSRELEQVPEIIVVTSYDDNAYLERALELGASAYLLKDSASEELVSCLKAVRLGDIYISPSLGSHTLRLPALSDDDQRLLATLTPMERQVLFQVAQYKTSKQIARELGVSFRTVQNHRAHISSKLDLHGMHQLMVFARERRALLAQD